MTLVPSRYVCALCGLPVREWGARGAPGSGPRTYWKHSGGGASTSCGRPPVLVERAKHEAESRAIAAYVRERARKL